MKIHQNSLLKSLVLLAFLGASFSCTHATEAGVTEMGVAPSEAETAVLEPVAVSPLRGYINTLHTSTNLIELKEGMVSALYHLMGNPLTDFGENAQDALDAATHVSVLSELDNGEILDDNFMITPAFGLFTGLLRPNLSPSQEAASQ